MSSEPGAYDGESSKSPATPAALDERDPILARADGDAPPEIERFLSPPPPAPGDGAPPSSSPPARRRSRRAVRGQTDSTPPKALPAGETVATGSPAFSARLPPPFSAKVPSTLPEGPRGAEAKARSNRPATGGSAPVIPPAPPVPTMPFKTDPATGALIRAAPTLRTVPRPAPRPGQGPEVRRSSQPSIEVVSADAAKAVPPPPPAPPEPPAAAAAHADAEDHARTLEQAPVAVLQAPPEPEYEVIRPMRIINVGTDPPPAVAREMAPPLAPSPPPVVEIEPVPRTEPATNVSSGSAAASPVALLEAPTAVPVSKPPKPPAVVEVFAVEDEWSGESTPRDLRPPEIADEIDALTASDDEHERISDVEIAGAADLEETPVLLDGLEADPATTPKKPPPPPLKRPISIAPPPPPAGEATAKPPPPPPRSIDPAASKRQKPWWEEIFSDDFIRTMEKPEPKVIKKECDFIEDRLGLERGAIMLDLACGAGSHAVELATRGYNVVGYDLSLAMLALAQDEAQERGQKINFLQGDMREMAFEEAFDGIYSWSTSFGYFDDEKNLNVLSRVRRALRQGGMFLLDVANRDYVCPRQPSLVWFEGDECVCMDEMHVDFFSSRLRVKRTVLFEDGRSRECEYSIRLFGLHELGKMLHETGFKVVEVTGHPAHPGVFFGSESPRIIVLAERA